MADENVNAAEDLENAIEKALEELDGDEGKEEAKPEAEPEAQAEPEPEAPAEEPQAAAEPESKPVEQTERRRDKGGKFKAKQPAVIEPDIDPPAEFTPEEKQAFRQGDIRAIQAAYQRVNTARLQEVTRAQSEGGAYRKLAEAMAPYIEASALRGKDPATAITEALAVINAIKKNPRETLTHLAQQYKVNLAEQSAAVPEISQQLSPLQEQVNTLTQFVQTQQTQALASSFGQVFEWMMSERNKAGGTRFPDVKNDEEGTRLAANIGSLVRQPDFQAAVRARIPGASLREFVVEAYRWYGGRVDESEGTKSQVNHLEKAKRAAASVPGRGASNGALPKKKFSDVGDAIEAALEALD